MFGTLKTLVMGANARAEESVRSHYALELIDQKIREAETGLKAAKATLAALMQRRESETRIVERLREKIADLTEAARKALAADKTKLAEESASAIAQMENELRTREVTIDTLDQKITRLRSNVEAGHRRILDLRQGAQQAKAQRYEQKATGQMNRAMSQVTAALEAEEMINSVLNEEDPIEYDEILSGINADLNGDSIHETLVAEGFAKGEKSTAADVLKRLQS